MLIEGVIPNTVQSTSGIVLFLVWARFAMPPPSAAAPPQPVVRYPVALRMWAYCSMALAQATNVHGSSFPHMPYPLLIFKLQNLHIFEIRQQCTIERYNILGNLLWCTFKTNFTSAEAIHSCKNNITATRQFLDLISQVEWATSEL